jgi:transposase
MKAVVCMNPIRKKGRRRMDRKLYGIRYRVECMFHGLKRFRCIATRYDKLRHTYLAMVHIACALLWLV